MTEPTPRPWFWDSYSRIYGGPPVVVGDGDPEYRQVVPLPNPTRGDVTTAQGMADARLIEDAVNAYDRLRAIEAAARDVVEALGFWESDGRLRVGFPVDRDGYSTPDQEAPFLALREALR